jgi:hypothetical protein
LEEESARITKRIRLEDLGLELRLLGNRIGEAGHEALGLDNMALAAKAYCPVDTGALIASVRAERRGPLETALVAGGIQYMNPKTGRPVDYARHVHNGTSRMPARPFLLQAVLAERLRTQRVILKGTAERI